MAKPILISIALCAGLVSAPAAAQDSGEGGTPAPVPAEVDTKLPVGPILLGGLAVSVVAVGAGFGWQADQEYDNYNEKPSESLADDVETHALAANILMFGGAGLAVGALLWWILSDDDEESAGGQGEVAWRPAAGPGSAGIAAEF